MTFGGESPLTVVPELRWIELYVMGDMDFSYSSGVFYLIENKIFSEKRWKASQNFLFPCCYSFLMTFYNRSEEHMLTQKLQKGWSWNSNKEQRWWKLLFSITDKVSLQRCVATELESNPLAGIFISSKGVYNLPEVDLVVLLIRLTFCIGFISIHMPALMVFFRHL